MFFPLSESTRNCISRWTRQGTKNITNKTRLKPHYSHTYEKPTGTYSNEASLRKCFYSSYRNLFLRELSTREMGKTENMYARQNWNKNSIIWHNLARRTRRPNLCLTNFWISHAVYLSETTSETELMWEHDKFFYELDFYLWFTLFSNLMVLSFLYLGTTGCSGNSSSPYSPGFG